MEPGLLIASPQLRDPNFQRTLVLLVSHSEEGALGLVINRLSPVRLGDVVEHLETLHPSGANRPVLWGGPVDRVRGFVVFRGRAPEGWTVGDGVAVSDSGERLGALIAAGAEFLLCLGYAGWAPGQLDREFAEGSWVHLEATPELVFESGLEERYDRALARLGLSVETLWMNPVDE